MAPDSPIPDSSAADSAPGAAAPAPVPLLVLSDGLPPVIDSLAGLTEAVDALGGAHGPVAIDAERASGYRYSQRAYLIQLRRQGSGTWLIDPTAFEDLSTLQEALGGVEWILHAATQDLPCLREVGLTPSALFDTELAGRLLNHPRVGLASLVETELGQRMRKEHSAADWSTRPLPSPWLEYAALDVEPLVELRSLMKVELVDAGKEEWARQEFEHLLGFEPAVRVDAWRRTSGVHKLRGRRNLAAAQLLWETRDRLAREKDVTPGRLIPDSALVAAAAALPTERGTLMRTSGFHGRGAERHAADWVDALRRAKELPESELPGKPARSDGPPHPRTWSDRFPEADRRFKAAREAMLTLAEAHDVPVENLLTPDYVRRLMWEPPAPREPAVLADLVREQLRGYGARPWQVSLVTGALTGAVLSADA